MSKLNICNMGTTGRSVLSTEVVPLYKERINKIKIKSNRNSRLVLMQHTSLVITYHNGLKPALPTHQQSIHLPS